MSSPSQPNLSRLRKNLAVLSQQTASYHEQLDRLRVSAADAEQKLLELTAAIEDKQIELGMLNNTYREKHLAWLDTLTGHQARADILRTRLARLEREESAINERLADKAVKLGKDTDVTFLTLT